MSKSLQSSTQTLSTTSRESGFSVLELILVVAVIGVVSTFAYIRLATAREVMRVTNSSREFTNFVQKARLDSIRRHATANQAAVTINNATTYTVTGDFDGNGVTDTLRELQTGVAFSATASDGNAAKLPITLTFDWRGRATCMDSSAPQKAVNSFTVVNSGETWKDTIAISDWGDASVSSGDGGESSYSNVTAAPAPPTGSNNVPVAVNPSTVIPTSVSY